MFSLEAAPVCRAALTSRIASEEHLDLDESALATVLSLAERYLPPVCTESQIRAALWNIRHDHPTVEALRSRGHCGHSRAWATWFSQAQAILRHADLDWSRDEAVERADLAQIAVLELSRSLTSYRYASRFSTWAYQVITRGVQRHLRDQSAKKRTALFERAVDPLTLVLPVAESELPESRACAHALEAMVEAELTVAFGARSARVFRLWLCEDLSADVIGRRVGLSQARVYALIAQARQYLSANEPILRWREAALG